MPPAPNPWDQFRKRTLPPSVDVFDSWMQSIAKSLARNEQLLRHELIVTTSSADQRQIVDALRLIQPMAVEGFQKRRFGRIGDGGYVMLDDLANIEGGLSMGIFDDDTWDADLASRGVELHQFDFSVERAPTEHRLLKFFPLKVVGEKAGADEITLADAVGPFTDRGARNLVLKIDIEGGEWDVFRAAKSETLDLFSQIVCEFHDLGRLREHLFNAAASDVFGKLGKTHQSIHVHGNNFGPFLNVCGIPVPDVLEVTFASRRLYRFAPSTEIFPTSLDHPNGPGADLFLGAFQFGEQRGP